MRKPYLSVFFYLAICLMPLSAAADGGRECVQDPDTGLLVPPNGSGACFGDAGFEVAILDADFELVIAFNGPDVNQWARSNPNGKAMFHSGGGKQVVAVYCAATTVLSGECVPFSNEPFVGLGRISLNSDLTANGSFNCPATARVKATGFDGYGNAVDFVAALTIVPDAEFGCKATVQSVDASPVLE